MSIAISRKHLKVIVAVLAAAIGALLWDWLYVSPAERMRDIVDSMVDAVERGDADALLVDLAPDYLDGDLDKKALQLMARAYFDIYGPTRVTVWSCRIKAEGQTAVAQVAVRTTTPKAPSGPNSAPSRWRLLFVNCDGRWYVDRITPTRIYQRDVSGLKDLAGRLSLLRRGRLERSPGKGPTEAPIAPGP